MDKHSKPVAKAAPYQQLLGGDDRGVGLRPAADDTAARRAQAHDFRFRGIKSKLPIADQRVTKVATYLPTDNEPFIMGVLGN